MNILFVKSCYDKKSTNLSKLKLHETTWDNIKKLKYLNDVYSKKIKKFLKERTLHPLPHPTKKKKKERNQKKSIKIMQLFLNLLKY